MLIKKVGIISLIVAFVTVAMLLLTVIMPVITDMTDVAYNDPSAANYTEYRDAVGSAPLWLYAVPLLVGGVAVFVVIKRPER